MDFKSLRIVLALLLPLLCVDGVWATPCADTDYDLRSQTEVDALGATRCSDIAGSLHIVSGQTDINNLNALSSLRSIGGDLYIQTQDSDLANLDGLQNITTVGALDLRHNYALNNIDALSKLLSVQNQIWILTNPELTNIDALGNITSAGEVRIVGNDALTSIDGLANISKVEGYVHVAHHSALRDLRGLSGLYSVGADLFIGHNAVITDLKPLSNLSYVGGDLTVADNDELTDLGGLESLQRVGGGVVIGGNYYLWGNAKLTRLDGLDNVASVGGKLQILNNPALSNVDSLSNIINVEGDVQIAGNDLLTNLNGLANIEIVEGALFIFSNKSLGNLGGLSKVGSVGGELTILSNDTLNDCRGVAPVLGWPGGPPNDSVVGDIRVQFNLVGCNSVDQILASVSGPTQPVITQSAPSSSSATLTFTPSTTTSTLFPITGYQASCNGSNADVSESTSTNLLDNTPITRSLTVSGYEPVSVSSPITVSMDITHSDPSDLVITLTSPQGTTLTLWDRGSAGGENLVGTFPTTLTPVDSLDAVASEAKDGDWILTVEDVDVGPLVREGVLNSWGIRITEEVTASGAGSPIEVTGITRGRVYTCTVAPVTKLGTTPVSDPYTVSVPYEQPSVPTITSTDFEDGKIILMVYVTDNGGAEITGYDATCTDGTNTYTGTSTSSPITVSGLTNGVAYTCTVTATNYVGTSSASAATDPITPEEGSTGLPIWLLYQINQ